MLAPLTINLDHKPNVQYPKEPTILRERRCYFAVYWQNGFLPEITQEIIVLFLFFLYNDFSFYHFILYIRVHVNRNPVEMVEHVFRCMRMTATLVSVQN